MRIVSEAVLREHVGSRDALIAVERGFRALAEGGVVQPPPTGIDFPEVEGEVHLKGAYIHGAPVFVFKVASGFYQNAAKGLPTGAGLVMIFDASTGAPVALLHDNGYLTDLRTAAAGALAARWLAPPSIRKLAILGSGIQARFQMRAISQVCQWQEAVAWSPTAAHLDRYVREMAAEFERPVRAADTAARAVADADLIVTVTPSRAPLFDAADVGSSATIIAVGSDGPEKQELDPALLRRADKVVADRLSQCVRLGEIHHAIEAGALTAEDVYAELGDIVTGHKAGREGSELIVCDLTGVGVQDAAMAEASWRKLQDVLFTPEASHAPLTT